MYKEVAKLPAPSMANLMDALNEVQKEYHSLAEHKHVLMANMVNMYAPIKVGDCVIITLREGGRKKAVKVHCVVWDTIHEQFAYIFKHGKGKKCRYIPSGHVTDMMPV